MTRITSAPSLRRSLALRTALGATLGIAAVPATAQTAVDLGALPQGATVDSGVVTLPGQTVAVTVTAPRAVVNWTVFNVPQGTTANFVNATPGTPTAVVLNRVTALGAGNTTTLGGDINAVNGLIGAPNPTRGVEVWIANPNGIVMGSAGNFNTQGFVATTRQFDATDVTNFVGGGTLTLSAPVLTPNSGITGSIGQIVTNGHVLAFIAPVIRLSGGTFDAGSGDAGFVVASDVTINNPGSPLSLVVNAGTRVGTGNALDLGGTVTAGNAYIVVSAQAAVNALLNVGADVTTASASNGVVVLGGDNGGAAAGPITVATGTGTSGSVGLTTGGALTANGGGAVKVLGRDAIMVGGALTTIGGGDVVVSNYDAASAATINVRANVASSGGYQVAGGAVTLGGGAAALTQGARGDVAITARRGAITGLSAVTLAADTDGSGDGMRLNAQGGFALAPTLLASGDAAGTAASAIDFTSATAADPFTLGDVRAGTLTRDGGTAGLSRTGAIATGNLALAGANSIVTTDRLTTGAVATGGALTLRGDAGVRVGSDIFSLGAGIGDVAVSGATVTMEGTALSGGLTVTAGAGGASFGDLTGAGAKTVISGAGIDGTAITGAGAVVLRGAAGPNTIVLRGGVGAPAAGVASLSVDGGDATLGALYVTGATRLGQGAGLNSLALTGAIDTESLLSDTTGASLFGTVLARGGDVDVGSSSYIRFDGPVDGTGALRVQAAPTGSVTFNGAVGGAVPFASFASLGPATVNLNGGALTTAGEQSYGGLLVLGANTVLTGTGATFTRGVSGAGGGVDHDLTLAFSGTTTLAGGSFTGVRNLATDSFGVTTLSGAITTSGSQSYGDAVSLGGATTLNSTGAAGDGNSHAISFARTVDGGAQLTVVTPGLLTFGDTVGGAAPLAGISATGAASTFIQGAGVTTSGGQAYGATALNGLSTSPVTLRAGGDVSFAALDGPRGLVVDTPGTTALAGGGGPAPDFITTDAGGTATVSGAIRTVGAQTYGDTLSLLGATTLTGTVAQFGGGVRGNGHDLTLNISGAQMLGNVTGVRDLTTDAAGTLTLTGDITTSGAQRYGEAVTLARSATLTAGPASSIVFGGKVDSADGTQALATDAALTRFSGDVGGGRALASLGVTGATVLGGTGTRRVTTTGAQSFNGPLRLETDAVLTGGTGSFTGGIDGGAGAHDLTLTFAGANALSGGGLSNIGDLLVNGTGTTTLSGTITTTRSQTYVSAVVLGGSTTLTSTGAAPIVLNALSGDNALTVATGGTATFNAGANGLRSITTLAGGTTVLNGTLLTTGAQGYGNDVRLAGDVTLASSGGGTFDFAGTVTGAHALALNSAGRTTFGGAVGRVGADGLADAALSPTALASVGAGAVRVNGGAITTSGVQSYAGPLELGADTVLTGTAGTLGGGVAGNGHDLTLNFSGPTTVTGGLFAGVRNFTSGGGGTTLLSGSISAAGTQTYRDDVVLAGDTALLSGDGTGAGAIRFEGLLDGGYGLKVTTTGVTSFGRAVGGVAPLRSITVDGPVAFGGGSVTTTGLQSYRGPATLSADTVLSGGGLAFGSTVDGAYQLSARAGTGRVSFAGALGGGRALTGLAVRAGTAAFATGNRVGTLAVMLSGGGLSFADRGTLTLGTVDGLSGVTADGVSLTGVGIVGNAGAPIDAGGGTVALNGGGGAIRLAGAVLTANSGADAIRIVGASDIGLGPVQTGAGGTLMLGASGAVTQTPGTTLSVGTLAGSVGGSATLTNAGNAIGRLGAFDAGGLNLRNGTGLTVSGPVSVGAGGLAIRLDAGDLLLAGDVAASGGTVSLNVPGAITQGSGRVAAQVLTGSAGGAMSLTGGNNAIERLAGFTSGSLTLVDQRALLVTGDVTAAGPLAVTAPGIDFTGRTLSGSGAVTLNGPGGAVNGDAVSAGADLVVNGGSISLGSARAAGALTLTSGGSLRLDAGQAGGNASFDANGLATLGAVTGGSGAAITVKATDATVNGTLRAGSVAFTNRAPAMAALRLGDGTAAGGFTLDATEVNRVDAAQLTLDAGAGDAQIGTLGFGSAAGAKRVDVLSTGRVDVTGAVSGSGAGREFRIGGSATGAGDGASWLRVIATADAGGRLLFDTAALDLRGTRIAAGQTGGFLDLLGPNATSTDAAALVANPNSALYNAALGGTPYPAGTALLTANSLTVRYTEYALFQNTGEPGRTAGVMLGTAAAGPQPGALTIESPAGTADAFALFGTIGGVGGDATALLPPAVVTLSGSDVARTRLNGCTVGSAEGCLSAVVTQPLLAVFDNSRVVAVRVEQELAVPFDPGVGTGNEALFAGLGLPDASVAPTECTADTTSPACGQAREQGK